MWHWIWRNTKIYEAMLGKCDTGPDETLKINATMLGIAWILFCQFPKTRIAFKQRKLTWIRWFGSQPGSAPPCQYHSGLHGAQNDRMAAKKWLQIVLHSFSTLEQCQGPVFGVDLKHLWQGNLNFLGGLDRVWTPPGPYLFLTRGGCNIMSNFRLI